MTFDYGQATKAAVSGLAFGVTLLFSVVLLTVFVRVALQEHRKKKQAALQSAGDGPSCLLSVHCGAAFFCC